MDSSFIYLILRVPHPSVAVATDGWDSTCPLSPPYFHGSQCIIVATELARMLPPNIVAIAHAP